MKSTVRVENYQQVVENRANLTVIKWRKKITKNIVNIKVTIFCWLEIIF